MRKLIVFSITSLDGYYEGPDNDVTALFDYRLEGERPDESIESYSAERLREANTLLFGRTSFEGFKDFWPSVADDGSTTPTQREISRLDNAIEKVVVSDSLIPEETAPWQDARIIGRANAHARIAELKRQPGKDILIFGSRTLWNDLVDELHLMISLVVLGAGTTTFSEQPVGSLRPAGTRIWDDSGNVLVVYEVRHRET